MSESKTKKDKHGKPEQKRLSRYYTEFVPLIESYFRQTVRSASIDGEIADLVKVVEKTRKEIKGWFKALDKAMMNELK